MASKLVSWSEMKSTNSGAGSNITRGYIETDNIYEITLTLHGSSIRSVLPKSESDADTTDFETNFKSSWRTSYTESVSVTNSITLGGGCPTVSSKYSIEYSGTDITMSSSYTNIYTYSGSGIFHGFALDFNSDSVRVRLVVDGDEIFALTLDEVERLQAFSSGGCDDQSGVASGICNAIKKASGNRLYFCPPCPISYSSSVVLDGQRRGGSNKKLKDRMIFNEGIT